MQLNGETLKKVMLMNDAELKNVILSIAKEKGLPLHDISSSDLAKIRGALNIVVSNPKMTEDILRQFGKGGR